MKRNLYLLLLFTLPLIFTKLQVASAQTFNGNPSNYTTLVDMLRPGDTLILEAGTYTNGLDIFDMKGTAALPITIQGPATNPRAVFQANGCICRNTIQINNSSYVKILNLELDGQDLNGIDAIKAQGDQNSDWAHHITLENLFIHNHDTGQQTVGISTKIPAWDWVVRNNVINSAGTGIYFGNSDGNAPFVNGIIENNFIADTIGYNMQIKHQNARTAVPGMPTADGQTIIRHNVFSKANNASTGGAARPNLLVGHWPLSGAGSNDVYLIYGNFFYQNPTAEPLFQGEGNVALYYNLFLTNSGTDSTAVSIQQHNDLPRNIDVFNNTVVATDLGIRVVAVDEAYMQQIVGNAVFSQTPFSLGAVDTFSDNISDSVANAGSYLVKPTALPGSGLDLFPLVGTLTGPPLNTTPFQSFSQWNLDFNGQINDEAFRGAYAGEGANPGWALDLDIKPPNNPIDLPNKIYLPLIRPN